MSDQESDQNEASQSEEEADEESVNNEESKQVDKAKPGASKTDAKQPGRASATAAGVNKNMASSAAPQKSARGKEASSSNRNKSSTLQAPKKKTGKKNQRDPTLESEESGSADEEGDEDGDSSETSSTASQNVASSGAATAAVAIAGAARMVFDGGALSDDEANSWEDSVSESEGSMRGDDYYDQEDYDEEVSPSPRKEGEPPEEEYGSEDEEGGKGRLVMNVYCTEYDVVKKVARKTLGYKLREYTEDHDGAIRRGEHNQKLVKEWDVTWHDLSITADFLAKMNPYQKINHYPGMYSITRKNHLARNLMRMKRAFPEEFSFFPATWVLPGDNVDFRNQFNKNAESQKKRQTYIVKPDGLSQGKGIFMSRKIDRILKGIETGAEEEGIGGWVVQHYLDQPHLVDDLKYDLRIYVLVNCVNPLRVYIHEEGLARFCTEPYKKPTARNMDNLFMHLTNYAINKNSDAYQAGEESSGDEESGHKRSLKAIMCILEACGADKEKLAREIKDIIVKTLATSQPYLNHLYRSCQPEDLDNSMCFQILGFDIMIDKFFKPWLIEVNQSPSFATDSPLDYKTKKAVLTDTFRMLNCTVSKRKKILKQQKAQMESRILTGKQMKMDPEEKAKLKEVMLKERFDWEEKRKGQWELIYPWPDEARNQIYGDFIKRAQEIWDEFTTGKGRQKTNLEDKKGGGNNPGNLNRQATNKQTINATKSGPGYLSNQGSSINLRSKHQRQSEASNRLAAGISARDLNNASTGAAPPKTSSGYPVNSQTTIQQHMNMNNIRLSDKQIGSVLKAQGLQTNARPSAMRLEVIDQASQEGNSPLHVRERQMSPNGSQTSDQKFKLSLQNYPQAMFHGQVPNRGSKMDQRQQKMVETDPVKDHLQRLMKPTNANQLPISNVKQNQMNLQRKTNQIVMSLETSKPAKSSGQVQSPSQTFQGNIFANMARPQGVNHSQVVVDPNADIRASDSKMSFMQRQIEAHERGHNQKMLGQTQTHTREKWMPSTSHKQGESVGLSAQGIQPVLSYHKQNVDGAGHRYMGSISNQPKTSPPRDNTKMVNSQISHQRNTERNMELEAFTSVKQNQAASKTTSKGVSSDNVQIVQNQHHATRGSNSSPGRGASTGESAKKSGVSDGRQSLQMAGSEQMNFLVTTNFITAKMNLEQMKQQVPKWALKEGFTNLDKQSFNQAYSNSEPQPIIVGSQMPSQEGQFSSSWSKKLGEETTTSQPNVQLQNAIAMQQKQQEMTKQAYENMQRKQLAIDKGSNASSNDQRQFYPATPDLRHLTITQENNSHSMTAGPGAMKSMTYTEQKNPGGMANYENQLPPGSGKNTENAFLQYDSSYVNRTISTSVKQNNKMMGNNDQEVCQSDSLFRMKDSIELEDGAEYQVDLKSKRHPPNFVMGATSNGQIWHNNNGNGTLRNEMSANQRESKLPEKQAVRMTQMPIFMQDAQGSHRMVQQRSKNKETPKNRGVSGRQTMNSATNYAHIKNSSTVLQGESMKTSQRVGVSRTVEQHSSSKIQSESKYMGSHLSKAGASGPSSRFDRHAPNTVPVKQSSVVMKNQPAYGHHVESSPGIFASNGGGGHYNRGVTDDQNYFQRRQAVQSGKRRNANNTTNPATEKQSRMIQGGLPVSHQPLKQGPGMKQLQLTGGSNLHLNNRVNHDCHGATTAQAGSTNNSGQRRFEVLTGPNQKPIGGGKVGEGDMIGPWSNKKQQQIMEQKQETTSITSQTQASSTAGNHHNSVRSGGLIGSTGAGEPKSPDKKLAMGGNSQQPYGAATGQTSFQPQPTPFQMYQQKQMQSQMQQQLQQRKNNCSFKMGLGGSGDALPPHNIANQPLDTHTSPVQSHATAAATAKNVVVVNNSSSSNVGGTSGSTKGQVKAGRTMANLGLVTADPSQSMTVSSASAAAGGHQTSAAAQSSSASGLHHNLQHNQFLLQKNNNQRLHNNQHPQHLPHQHQPLFTTTTQGTNPSPSGQPYLQKNQAHRHHQHRSYMMNSSSNNEQTMLQPANAAMPHSQTVTTQQPSISTPSKQTTIALGSQQRPNGVGIQNQHPQRGQPATSMASQSAMRTSSSRGGNRRLGRALGQGKSAAVNSGNNAMSKGRGQIIGTSLTYGPAGAPHNSQNQYQLTGQNRTGKSVGVHQAGNTGQDWRKQGGGQAALNAEHNNIRVPGGARGRLGESATDVAHVLSNSRIRVSSDGAPEKL